MIPTVQPGETITAAQYNALAAAVRRLSHLTAAFPLEARRHAGGVHLSLAFLEREAICELTGDLHVGGSASAKILDFDGVSWVDADTSTVVVHDALGTFEFVSGDRVLVRFHRQSGKWIVWNGKC
ncbi:MAG: hypothetical protein SGJ19_13365 [Planctomycetia bacterium]|nr:hypothetical protein [Planctomycetia bacterium]